jgi:hypothetical protein
MRPSNVSKVSRLVTAATIQTKLAAMAILATVAGGAGPRNIGSCASPVTTVTAQAGVSILQRKLRVTVIKLPQWPAIGTVAGLALLAEVAIVCILLTVTLNAGLLSSGIGRVGMTFSAGNNGMHALKWEPRQFVIEPRCAEPVLGPVAKTAILQPRRLMHVITAMATEALDARTVLQRPGVTLQARCLRMFTL